MYDDMREHCPNKLCENAVCLLPTVPQSTENTINNNILLSPAIEQPSKRRCGTYLETGHNLSTCTK